MPPRDNHSASTPASASKRMNPTDPALPRRSAMRIYIAVGILAIILGGAVGAIVHFAFPGRSPNSQPPIFPINPAAATQPTAAYAGSKSCQQCHAAEYDKWRISHHGIAERELDPKLDEPAFVPERTFTHGTQSTTLRKSGGEYQVTAPLGDVEPAVKNPMVPVRAIGVDPLVQYLVQFPNGRLQTLEASYDPAKNEWFNVYGTEDRKPGEWGHWTGRGMNWNAQCATCHNTNIRKNYDIATDSYKTTMSELTVSCESCHGPMQPHVEWQGKIVGSRQSAVGSGKDEGRAQKREEGSGQSSAVSGQWSGGIPSTKPATDNGLRTTDKTRNSQPATRNSDPTLTKLSRRQNFETCGTCHSRRGEITAGFTPGDSYADHYWLALPDQTDLFYPDGQIRDEDYEYTSFLASKMHAAGVRCVDCHDPHAAKPVLQGNALCMKCHTGTFPNSPIIDPAKHTFHKPDSAGALCTSCHMPQTPYMQRHFRHDHGFTIPDPVLTKELSIPNACNRCHTDKDADWSIKFTEEWYGAKMQRPTRERARIMAKARQGDPSAKPALLKILAEDKIPLWQGSAAIFLGNHLDDVAVIDALTAATTHKDPLVRDCASRALTRLAEMPTQAGPLRNAQAAIIRLLDDPARTVRVRAAWALRNVIDPATPAGQDLMTYLNHNADQPGGAMQMGMWRLARNDSAGAVTWFEKAVRWDPNSWPLRDALAVAYSTREQFPQAVEQLEAAVKIDPRDAELWFKLGLAYAEVGQKVKTIAAIERAVAINPRHARALYNLGLAYSAADDAARAIDNLARAEQADPTNADAPYALATVYLHAGDPDRAKAAARRALRINPRHVDAMQLLTQIGGP